MSYANDFTGKLEDTARDYLRTSKDAGNLSAFARNQILAGIDDEDVNLPRVVCICDSARIEENFDANWNGELEVKVIASAEDTTREEFRDMCGEVFAHFFQLPVDNLTNLSSSEHEFTAQAVYARRQEKNLVATDQDTRWEKSLFLEVHGCGSVVA